MFTNALEMADSYKTGHHRQYPDGTQFVFSNLTARSSKLSNLPEEARDGVVLFGLSYFVQEYLGNKWNQTFFHGDRDLVCRSYYERMSAYINDPNFSIQHMKDLHDLGYLPILIRALPEGTVVPYKVPMLSITNTHPDFGWLTNYLETIMSNVLWMPITSATTARFYRALMNEYADLTGGEKGFVPFAGHDFSMRGMPGLEAACISGAGHLTSFCGTDTIPAVSFLEQYYYAENWDGEYPVGCSVPATEHSVMSLGTDTGEFETFRSLILDKYPDGIISIVSDTWDLWRVLTEYMPLLKDEIKARGMRSVLNKVVIRPDSGDPVKIMCGDPDALEGSPRRKGVIQLLWDTFGGTINEKGFKRLDPCVGAIYGDSITPERCHKIMHGLYENGFETTCMVFGIGSYTYQCVTRDTHGLAVKATWGQVNGEAREIYKDPTTDDGTKKSLRGLFRVLRRDDGSLYVEDRVPDTKGCIMHTAFKDGVPMNMPSLKDIRKRLNWDII